MKLHDLAPPKGATKAKRRVGRGTGGKGHKTAGRGTKGLKARGTVPAGFEGGQLPLMQRIPKLKGFTNPFRVSEPCPSTLTSAFGRTRPASTRVSTVTVSCPRASRAARLTGV